MAGALVLYIRAAKLPSMRFVAVVMGRRNRHKKAFQMRNTPAADGHCLIRWFGVGKPAKLPAERCGARKYHVKLEKILKNPVAIILGSVIKGVLRRQVICEG